MSKIVFLLLLMSSVGWADGDQIVTDMGLGQFGSKGASLSQDKFVKFGIEEELWSPFYQKFNLGGWLDDRGPGYSNAAFIGYQIGFQVTNQVFEGSVWTGPSLITTTDSELGGYFEFNESIYFGIVDKDKNSIGIVYNHFSDAGFTQINRGRDYIGIEIKCPF